MVRLYVKEHAKEHGMTLIQVCEKCGYKSYPSFLRQINNPDSISMMTVNKIAAAIGIETNDLFSAPAQSGFVCPYCGKPIRVQITAQDATQST